MTYSPALCTGSTPAVEMCCGNGPVSGAGSCLISASPQGGRLLNDLGRAAAAYKIINTAPVTDIRSAMAQDGLANLKEGLEETFADLGIQFQLNQVRENNF